VYGLQHGGRYSIYKILQQKLLKLFGTVQRDGVHLRAEKITDSQYLLEFSQYVTYSFTNVLNFATLDCGFMTASANKKQQRSFHRHYVHDHKETKE
jgi:hypothetical protein